MTTKEKYKIKNLELQKKICEELEYVKQGKSRKNIGQLQYILTELKENEDVYDNAFHFPRFMIDSWDYSDELGVELMKLVELYNQLEPID